MAEELKVPNLIAAKETGPGPGRYALPSTCGSDKHDFTKRKNPIYSFGTKSYNETMFKKDASPGPQYYIDPRMTRVGKNGEPHYSILGRQNDVKCFLTPAPGAYYPEKTQPQGERHAPAFSMASRTRYRKRDTTPAANANALPSLIGTNALKTSAPCYSMVKRSDYGSFSKDLSITPGPGTYKVHQPDINKRKGPAYSILGRSFMPGDSVQKPGPGAHYPERVTVNKHRAPSCSMGIRHSEYITPLIVNVD